MVSIRNRFAKRKKRRASDGAQNTSQSSNSHVSLEQVLHDAKQSKDFIFTEHKLPYHSFFIGYYKTLTDQNVLQRDVLPPITREKAGSLEELAGHVPIEPITITCDPLAIRDGLLNGSVLILWHAKDDTAALIPVPNSTERELSPGEVEYSVVGAKEAFIETLDTNLFLIRKRLPTSQLRCQELKVGSLSETRVAVLHIEGVANQENVNTVMQRIQDLQYDQITDSAFIAFMVADNSNSPFPQMIDTERPDRVAAGLAEGKVVILVDGAPHALIAPTTLIEFFSSFEDYSLNWSVGSFFRLLRIFAVLFSILITPVYVAVLTYHYELIPKDLVSTLVTSRREIPLPPIMEALFLELAIELLREAGARLPAKIGSTIGIVGGIVIGTASVEAGLTSNVLLIFVALAALASFTTPIYTMGNTIRLIRFPFIIFAQLWGLIGIALCFCFTIAHLLRLTSLGRPYLEPIFPPRVADMKDTLIRLPFASQRKRPVHLQTGQPFRMRKSRKQDKKNDIDE